MSNAQKHAVALRRDNVASANIFSFASARVTFQDLIAELTSTGGGTLSGPVGDYIFDTNSEATCLVCSGVPIVFDFPKGTRFFFGYYPLALINFVGCDGGGINNVEFVFTGTRPATSSGLTSNHFGFNGTGLISPPDFAAFVSILGSSNITLNDIQWRGADTIGSHLKEAGVQIIGGTGSGPNFGTAGTAANPTSDAVFSYGNRLIRCKNNDTTFGITAALQDGLEILDYFTDRYYTVGFTGGGHAIYNTGMTRRGVIRNVVDKSTKLFPITSATFVGASTMQLRSWVHGVVDGVVSERVEGLGGFLNATSNSIFINFHWKANRVPDETYLLNTSIVTIVPSDTVSVQSGNYCANWVIEDALDAGTGRSSNCPIFGSGGSSAPSANITNNVYENIHVTHYPDAAFGKAVLSTYGQNERWNVFLNSMGSATGKALLQMNGSAASLLLGNTVDVTLTGPNVLTYNVALTNSGGGNVVNMHGVGNISQQNTSTGMVAGDRFLHDSSMYSTDIRLINNVPSHNIVVPLTFSPTVPTPCAGLTYVGSAIDCSFNATGVFVVTWPASFRKAADGASAAGKSASTRFVCTDAVTPIWVQQGGALTYN